jgi:hypothetical protein
MLPSEKHTPQKAFASAHKLALTSRNDTLSGGISKEGNIAWLLSTNSLQVVDLKLHQTLAEFKRENLSTCSEIQGGYLVLTVLDSHEMIVVDPGCGARVLKRLILPFKPTIVQPLDPNLYSDIANTDNTTNQSPEALEFSQYAANTGFPVAIGSTKGQVLLMDLRLDQLNETEQVENYLALEEPSLRSKVTAISVLPEINALAVGHSTGEYVLWSLTTLQTTIRGNLNVDAPITHFCFQEASKYEGYLWVGQTARISQLFLFKCTITRDDNSIENVSMEKVFTYALREENTVSSSILVTSVLPEKDPERHEDLVQIPELSPSSLQSPRPSTINHNRACFVWETVTPDNKRSRQMRIFDLERSNIQNKKPALYEYPLADIASEQPILSSWIDLESLRRFNDEVSFNVKVLLPTTLYEISFVSASLSILNDLEENGPEIFHDKERLEKIYKKALKQRMIKHEYQNPDYTQMQRDLWSVCIDNGLACSIINYIHAEDPSLSQEDEPHYLLSAPTSVLAWVRDQRKIMETQVIDLMSEVRRSRGHRPQSIANQDRDYRRSRLIDCSSQLESLRSIAENLLSRAYHEQDQEKIAKLLNRIVQFREHVRVLEWFTAQGFIPVASGLYNYNHLKTLWKQRRNERRQMLKNIKNPGTSIREQETHIIWKLCQLEQVTTDMEPIYRDEDEDIMKDEEVKKENLEEFFIDKIMKCANEKYEGDYPPEDLNNLFDLFLNDNTDSVMYKHVAILYFLTDYTMSPPSEISDFCFVRSIISTYAKTFSIPNEWQRLIMGLWQVDSGGPNEDNLDSVAYISAYDAPTTEWHDDVLDVLLCREDYLAAKRLAMRYQDISLRYMRVLLSSHMVQSAFDLQRRAVDLDQRRLLFFCILTYASYTQTFASDWFCLPFDNIEEGWLTQFLENNIKGSENRMNNVDLLFTYYVLRSRYAAAIKLYEEYLHESNQPDYEVRKAMLDNLKRALPKAALLDTSFGPNTPKSKGPVRALSGGIQVTTPQSVSKKKRPKPSTPSTLTAINFSDERSAKHQRTAGPTVVAMQNRQFKKQLKNRQMPMPTQKPTISAAPAPTTLASARPTVGGKSPALRFNTGGKTLPSVGSKGPPVQSFYDQDEDENIVDVISSGEDETDDGQEEEEEEEEDSIGDEPPRTGLWHNEDSLDGVDDIDDVDDDY